MRTLFVLCLAGLTVGCNLAKTRTTQAVSSAAQQPEDEPENLVDPPESWAGSWTRKYYDGTEQRFEVSDDGHYVRGELVAGGEDVFSSYTFELRRDSAGRLKGATRYELKDYPDSELQTKWQITTRDAQSFDARVEFVELGPLGGLLERGTEQQTFRFTPTPVAEPAEPEVVASAESSAEPAAEPAAESAPPPAPPAMDWSAYVTPLPSYAHLLYEGMAIGHWAAFGMGAPGQLATTRTALVGETEAAWIIETDNQVNQPDLMLAVFVDKQTGATLRAFVGMRGELAKEKTLASAPAAAEGAAPETVDEQITVAAGTFAARRSEQSGMTSWVGIEGDAEGVLLKTESQYYNDELEALEADVSIELAGRSWNTLRLQYTSGNQMWQARGDLPWFPNAGQLRFQSPAAEAELVGMGDDAAAELQLPE